MPAVSARSAPVVPASETSPFSNVAVITLFDKELGNQTHSKEKKQRKSLAQENKKKRSLAVQASKSCSFTQDDVICLIFTVKVIYAPKDACYKLVQSQ